MTRTEDERLGIVETEVSYLRSDVTEIKGDVKAIAAIVQSLQTAAAVASVLENRDAKNRAELLDRLRTLGPWVVGSAGLVLGLIR